MFRKILLTGGAGFIGANLLRFLLRERPDVEVVNLDALTYSGNLENLADLEGNSRYRFVHGDVCDSELVCRLAVECDAVVHLAAESHVDRSIADAAPFVRTNVLGTQVLLDAVRRAGGRRFLHVSTDEVYGSLPLDQPEQKFTEESPLRPNSPYAASKAAADLLVQSCHRTHGLDVVITRCSNNFGPFQFPEKVIPLFVTNLLTGRKVPLYGDGLNVRDWIHVDDHCEALLAVLERGQSGEVYNIGGDNEQSNLELTYNILGAMSFDRSFIEHVPDRPGHDRRYAIDASKMQDELGWRATRSTWPEVLIETVRWYSANTGWWRRVKAGEHEHREYPAQQSAAFVSYRARSTGAEVIHARALSQVWQPLLFDMDDPAGIDGLNELLSSSQVAFLHDTIADQLSELMETRHPSQKLTSSQVRQLVTEHLHGTKPDRYGSWVYYPWSQRLVHVLPEKEYRELRTSRNRNKITADEQRVLSELRLGVVGLSVGQATAITLALEEVGGEIVLADYDVLSLSNMNRLRSPIHNVCVNKAVLTAREISEINPYSKPSIYSDGVTTSNIDDFLCHPRKLDILFEECDDFLMKIRLRERARELGIPVLTETSDRGLIDIERFDLEPDRPLFHGLIEGFDLGNYSSESTQDKMPLAFEIVGGTNISERLAASSMEIGETIKTWPQLASAVALGGAINTDAARRIALGELNESGRYYVDLGELIADGVGQEVTPSDRSISAEALAGMQLPEIHRALSNDLSAEEVQSLVSYATMAPSGGNAQPWYFVYEDRKLQCYRVPERSEIFLDYQGLASYLALGAAVENLALAASQAGLDTQLTEFPVASNPNLVCAVTFSASIGRGRSDSADRALFGQIAKRMTNRKVGERKPMRPEDGEFLEKVTADGGGRLQILQDVEHLRAVADILGKGDRIRFSSKIMHSELISEIRWSRKEVEETRDGLDVAALELSAVDQVGLRLTSNLNVIGILSKTGGGRVLEKPSRKAIAAASAVGLVTVPGGTTPRALFHGGRAAERVWLAATARGYSFQPMTALVCLFWRLLDGGYGLTGSEKKKLIELRKQHLELFDVRPSDGEVMLFRITHSEPPTAHSLRRHVEDVSRLST